VLNHIQKWKDGGKIQPVERPSWDDVMMEIAHVVKKRSMDAQTQCGCVITNPNHQILGIGYNSFPRAIDDSMLPNMRDEKYPFMIHGEENAILNCEHRPEGGIAYVTIKPCVPCLSKLWQVGIVEVIHDVDKASMTENETRKLNFEVLAWLMSHQLTIREHRK